MEVLKESPVKEVPAQSPSQDDIIQTHYEDAPARLNSQTLLALMAVASQYNAYLFTLLMPSTVLSYINKDLGPDPSYTWITVSWTLVAAVVVTVSGRLADIFGRRYFLIAGAVFGCIGALVGATAKSINQMIASGVLFGLAGGFQEMCFGCIQELVPNKWRIITVGIFELTALVPFFSPLIAYAMLAHTALGWRSIYWYIFAYEICGLALLVLFYKPPSFNTKHRVDQKTKLELLRQLDYVGVILFGAGCICFLLGVSWGGHYPWKSVNVILPIVLGVCLLIALGFWEKHADLEYPILPPFLFRRLRSFTAVLVVCFVGGMLYYSMNVLWPQQSAAFFVPADDIIIRGVYSNMVSFGTILGGVITVGICQHVGHERWQLVVFMIIQTALIGSLASVGMDDKVQAIATIIVLSSTVTPPQLLSFVMISLGLPDQADIGVANGLASTFRLLGGAVATAVYSAVRVTEFTSVLDSKIRHIAASTSFPKEHIPALINAAALGTDAAFEKVPGITTEVIDAATLANKQSYVQAFKLVYLVAIAFGGVAIISCFFTKTIPKEVKTAHRAVHLENKRSEVKTEEQQID